VSKEHKERKPRYFSNLLESDTEEITESQIKILKSVLKETLTPETTNGSWCPSCVVYKQSYPVSYLIKSFLGGDILQCPTKKGDIHYWNILPTGEEIDLTSEGLLFGGDILIYDEVDILNEESMSYRSIDEAHRFSLLQSKTESVIYSYGVETLNELMELYRC
jgi:hypothetical protein